MIRTFIAVKIAKPLAEAVDGLVSELRTSNENVKWVAPENLHLTLKFLGNVEESRVDEIAGAILQASEGIGPFEISLRGVGAFPNERRPKVVWVGIEKGRESLVSLSQQIEDRLEALGFEREKRRFSPHLTIGRLRRGGRPGDLPDRLGIEFDGGECSVDRICLMKSTLTPQGPIYEELRQAILKEEG
jgi:2'-5' RNA ligase